MISLTIRSYEGETDLQAISDLLKACEAVDKLNQDASVSELQQTSENPSLDKARDIRMWEDPDGKLIGIGHLEISTLEEVIEGFLSFRVHPSARSGNLQGQIIAWGEERGVRVKLRADARDDKADFIALLESSGLKSERSLKEPIPFTNQTRQRKPYQQDQPFQGEHLY